jgi:hypothetical protein
VNYGITEEQINKIIGRWGQDIYAKILQQIEIYSEKWNLFNFSFIDHYSAGAVFCCKSELYGECVLKIGCWDEDDFEFAFTSQYNVLREYNGGRYVKLYEADIDLSAGKKVMLLERVILCELLKN